ncbi:M28 family peptidase [bacterium]|nr:M28 family peptidase [bacterium]
MASRVAAVLGFTLLGLLVLLTGCQQQVGEAADLESKPAEASQAKPETKRPVANYSLTSDAIEKRISTDLNFLASDEQEGRGPYSKGLQASSEYIADQFSQAGLKTKLIEGGPYQVFSQRGNIELGDNNHLEVVSAGKSLEIPLGQFKTLSASLSGKFDLPVVFAGYGITSVRDRYDDFEGIDVSGKAVILVRHEPDQSGRTQLFAGKGNSKFAYLSSKITNAIEHGAGVILFVSDEVAVNKNEKEVDPLLSFQIRMPKNFEPKIPVLHLKRAVVDDLLSQADKPSLSEWEKEVDETLKPNSFDLPGVIAKGEVEIEKSVRTQQNVLGVLPGRGELASEVIVVGAHYDHLGYGGSGSLAPWTREIHNGADDNASGTVAMLETVRECVGWNDGDRRTILFMAFAAEEQGLIGSEFYVRHPLFANENTAAMLNYDMVGRLRKDQLTLYGFNTAEQFEAWVDEAAQKHGLTIKKIPGGYGPSDHASFYGRGIPVMHNFTGFHAQYHRPSDDIERINVPGIRQIVAMNVDILKQLATQKITPVKNAEGSLLDLYLGGLSQGNDSDEDEAEQDKRALGVQVDDPTPDGIPIKKVTPGSAAEKAGIRDGDILVEWGDQKLESVGQLRKVVLGTELGKKVPVRIMRGMLLLEVEVEFPK